MHTQANFVHRTPNREQPHAQFPEHDDCFAVRQAARRLSQLYERHLSAAGLTPTQFSILGALGARGANGVSAGALAPSLTMAQLARTMVMDRTTLLRAAQDEFERRFGPRRAAWLRRELLRITRAV